jgi:hypothetical protein
MQGRVVIFSRIDKIVESLLSRWEVKMRVIGSNSCAAG